MNTVPEAPRPRRPLLLCGGPAAGKSTCGRSLALGRQRGVFIDGDEIRQLVVAGAAFLWEGAEGERQHDIGARHTALLANNFRRAGFDVVIADYVTPSSLSVYRTHLPDCIAVSLRLSTAGARQRAATRRVYLTDQEFELLHNLLDDLLPADVVLDVENMSVQQQTDALQAVWISR